MRPPSVPPLVYFCSSRVMTDRASILAEVGTLHLEFYYLSAITHNSKYVDKVQKVRSVLRGMATSHGLYYNVLSPTQTRWLAGTYRCSFHYTLLIY